MSKSLLFLFFQLPILVYADSVVQNVIVTGTAGPDASVVACTISAPQKPQLHVECVFQGSLVLKMDGTALVGMATGFGGFYSSGGVTVTFMITQPTAGQFSYDMAAGTAHGTGSL